MVSDLYLATWPILAADLGAENPLAPLHALRDEHAGAVDAPGLSETMRENMRRGRLQSCLPYTMQDAYSRDQHLSTLRTAVLENELLRATFLLDFGGRLWSLYHKQTRRELLHTNPALQPANLAVRNAWFAGGVEWNIGIIGHSPHTCAPLYAARLATPDGMPVLRLYEWERIRQVPYQIDAYLPDGSPVLLVRVRISNPHDHAIPMYWWSNMAVPESPDTRVVAPATAAYTLGYGSGGLRVVSVPRIGDVDITYPTAVPQSADFFFDLPDQQRPWIAALDGAGRGLVQTSTDRLCGRKLFVWGVGAGGQTWQDFLSTPGHPYCEIQAGLARTQMEYLEMPAGAEWAWLEAYGLLDADAEAVHGADWAQATQAVEDRLERLIPRARLRDEFVRSDAWADQAPIELLQRGSGWGALELLRREAVGQAPFCTPALVFDDQALSDEQAPWLGLLRDGSFPKAASDAEPGGYLVQPEWRTLLEAAVAAGHSTHWPAWLHLGVMRYHTGDLAGAREAWEQSIADRRTPWALRNLATLAADEQLYEQAATLYLEAYQLRPACMPLAIECGQALLAARRPQDWLDSLSEVPEPVRSHGRVRLLEARAALAVGDVARVASILAQGLVIADLREADQALSELWYDFQIQRLCAEEGLAPDQTLRSRVERDFPVPKALDFRMAGAPPEAPADCEAQSDRLDAASRH
jgi:tetratricopeptide (TPR) repeat protein